MATAVANATAGAAPAAARAGALISRTGEHIFVYTNINTKQTVYSLSRSMHNASVLRQLTFVGKKSVPAALRKDHWSPLCVVSFPSAAQGLDAYRKLREFRIRHETQYERSIMFDPKAPQSADPRRQQLVGKREKQRILQDQRANSVADMAAVLFMQTRAPTGEEMARARWWHELPKVQTKRGLVTAPDRPKFGKGSKATLGDVEWRGSVKGVRINWSDILDAEFAQTWPDDVLHGTLEQSRYTAVWPPANLATRSVGEHREAELGSVAEVPAIEQPVAKN